MVFHYLLVRMRLLLVLVAVLDVTRAGSCHIRFDTKSIYYGEKKVDQYICEKVTPSELTQDNFHSRSYPIFTANDSHLVSVYKEMFANMGSHYLDLKVLAMVNSHIRNISDGAFDKFVGLTYLDLRHNEITEIGFLKTIISWLETVDLSYNKVEHISVINLSHPRKLSKLNLAFNKIITVDLGFVQNVTALNVLDLSYNLLENINEGVFRSVPYVVEIYLTNCTRRKLDFRIFESTIHLRVLNVSNNDILLPQLTSLPQLNSLNLSATKVPLEQEMFIASRRLQHLDLSCNGFKNLEKSVFIYLKYLESLHLHHNDLESLNQDMFKGLKKTVLLNCSSNKIESLQPNVFAELISLRSLDLARNGLAKIETGAFHSLTELRFLDLSENVIETLHEMTFEGLNLLLELRLNGNRVKSLASKPFAGLHNLLQLDLSGNPYHVVETNAFVGLTSLNKLNLSRLAISNIEPNALAPFKLLHTLDLSHNSIDTILEGALKMEYNIREVWVNDNGIRNMRPGAFNRTVFQDGGYYPVNFLQLSRNSITSLKKGTFAGITYVDTINLADNAIESIEPGAFEGCIMHTTTLGSKIILDGNKITTLKADAFLGVKNLERLELRDNAIVAVDVNSFNGLNSLRVLSLSGNLIKELPLGSVRHFTNLTELQLAENFLTSFDVGFFSNLQQLTVLNISYNSFVALDVNVLYPMRTLSVLQLDGNCLSELNYSALLKYNDNLRYISVNHNMWTCSSLIDMLRAFRDRYVQYLFNTTSTFLESSIEGISCSRDGNNGGGCHKAVDVKLQKIKDKAKNNSNALRAGLSILGIMIYAVHVK